MKKDGLMKRFMVRQGRVIQFLSMRLQRERGIYFAQIEWIKLIVLY
jgi:hypothetical protein